MDYMKLSKDQLIEIIEEIKLLNRQLLKESEDQCRLDFAWTGNLGHWYWNVKTNHVTFNHLKIEALGYTKEEIPDEISYQFFTEKLHPEDYHKTMSAMVEHLKGEKEVYEAEYRIKTKEGSYRWFYDRGRITQYDVQSKPVFLAGIVFDITEKKEKQAELENEKIILAEQSSTDELTKVRNYRALINLLSEEVNHAIYNQKPLSLAILDIDDFKKINDRKGHMYGNGVLIEIVNLIMKNIRATDILGRFGGEEFMIVFPGTGLGEAAIVTERVRQAVEEHVFQEGVKITISAGVKEYLGEKLEAFIKLVDSNLYEAKKRGKNKTVSTNI